LKLLPRNHAAQTATGLLFVRLIAEKEPQTSNLKLQTSLSRIGAILQPPWKHEFGEHNERKTDAGSGQYFANKIQETAELQPFEQHKITMMYNGEYEHVNDIRRPVQATGRRRDVVELGTFFLNEDVDEKGPEVGDEYAGSGMKSRRFHKHIQRKTQQEAREQQRGAFDTEGQPEDEQKIKIGRDELVQGRYLVEYKYLNTDEQEEADNIF
jgi:hypothetical protein